MGLARAASARGDCTRRQVGAVVVHDHHVYGTGYNGSARESTLSCLKGDCPRGKHYLLPPGVGGPEVSSAAFCSCGQQWPCPDAVEPGSSYDTGPGICISIHAEMNAGIDALKHGLPKYGDIFTTERPCDGCFKFIWQCQIGRAFWPSTTAKGRTFINGIRNPFVSWDKL